MHPNPGLDSSSTDKMGPGAACSTVALSSGACGERAVPAAGASSRAVPTDTTRPLGALVSCSALGAEPADLRFGALGSYLAERASTRCHPQLGAEQRGLERALCWSPACRVPFGTPQPLCCMFRCKGVCGHDGSRYHAAPSSPAGRSVPSGGEPGPGSCRG